MSATRQQAQLDFTDVMPAGVGVKPARLFAAWVAAREQWGNPLSASSQRQYASMWGRFCEYVMGQERRVIDVDQALIERFLDGGHEGGRFDAIYQRRYLQLLRDLLGYYFKGRRDGNPAEDVLVARRKATPVLTEKRPVFLNQFEEHQLRRDLAKPPTDGPWMRLRDWAMLQVILGSGIKPSEVIALDLEDVTRNAGPNGSVVVLNVDAPSGVAARQVELAAWAQPALDYWLASRERLRLQGSVLFPASRQGSRLTASGLYRVAARQMDAVDLEKRHKGAEVLRATFAVKNLASGQDPDAVQQWLGITSIERYRALADGKHRPV